MICLSLYICVKVAIILANFLILIQVVVYLYYIDVDSDLQPYFKKFCYLLLLVT